MEGPVKVIVKYKNGVGRIGYKILIFLRWIDQQNKDLMSVLQEIKDMTLDEAQRKLSQRKKQVLVKAWGERWYTYVYTRTHYGKTQVGGDDVGVGTLEQEEEEDNDEEGGDLNLEEVKVTSQKVKQVIKKTRSMQKATVYDFTNDPFEEILDDQLLKRVVSKEYISGNEVFEDDTVFRLKTKICHSLRLHERFEEHHLIPSRVYMWAETDDYQAPLGSRWMIQGQAAPIPTEPPTNLNKVVELQEYWSKYSSLIRRYDEDLMVLSHYPQGAEFFFIEIYTLLANNPPPAIFAKIYFPQAATEFGDIVSYLRGASTNDPAARKAEIQRMTDKSESLTSDLLLEQSVTDLVEAVPVEESTPFVIQTIMYSFIEPVPLQKVYDSFLCTPDYPYIQLYVAQEERRRKFLRNKSIPSKEEVLLLQSWFDSSTYGLSFRVAFEHRYMPVSILEQGRIQFKVQWKEEDKKTMNDNQQAYSILQHLIEKINTQCNVQIKLPALNSFRSVFVNSILPFSMPRPIDYFVLSEFARYFFPYVAVVVKRVGNRRDKQGSSWGAYLRFRRVSRYADRAIIQQRILYYSRNFAVDNNGLTQLISTEFNMTMKDAADVVRTTLKSTPVVKNQVVKPMSAIKRVKPSGVSIEIQGKTEESYKIRVIGAKDERQMHAIFRFVNRLLVLYVESLVLRLPQRKALTTTLSSIAELAEKRLLLRDVVQETQGNREEELRKYDADKLSASRGRVSYTRECQNSGDIIRRPIPVLSLKDLTKRGYRLDKQSGLYRKQVLNPSTRKMETVIAVKKIYDGKEIYYICDPKVHGRRMFLGVLTKSTSLLPCCFKKNQLTSKNTAIRAKFRRFITGVQRSADEADAQSSLLYIKKFSARLTPQRLHTLSLPLAKILGEVYIFGLGGSLVQALAVSVKENEDTLLKKMADFLVDKDPDDRVFTSLRQGDTRLTYVKRENLASEIMKGAINPMVLLELFPYTHSLNVVVLEVPLQSEDVWMVCPGLRKEAQETVILLMDAEGGYHLIVGITKRGKTTIEFISTFRGDTFQLCQTDTSRITTRFYAEHGETIQSQVIDHRYKVTAVINKDGVPLPTEDSGGAPDYAFTTAMPVCDLDRVLETYKKRSWIRPQAIVVTEDNTVLALLVEIGSLFYEREVEIPVRSTKKFVPEGMGVVVRKHGQADDDRVYLVKLDLLYQHAYDCFRTIFRDSISGKKKNTRSQIEPDVLKRVKPAKVEFGRETVVKASVDDLLYRDGKLVIPVTWYEEFMNLCIMHIDELGIESHDLLDACEPKYLLTVGEEDVLDVRGTIDMRSVLQIIYGKEVADLAGTRRFFSSQVTETVISEQETYYSQLVTQQDDGILRALINGLYHVASRVPGTLGPKHSLQTEWLLRLKGRITTWLDRQLGVVPPPSTGVKIITRPVILSFQNETLLDERWMFSVWCFHCVTRVRVFIINGGDQVMYVLEKGNILEGPSTKKGGFAGAVVVRVMLNTSRIPVSTETLYMK